MFIFGAMGVILSYSIASILLVLIIGLLFGLLAAANEIGDSINFSLGFLELLVPIVAIPIQLVKLVVHLANGTDISGEICIISICLAYLARIYYLVRQVEKEEKANGT